MTRRKLPPHNFSKSWSVKPSACKRRVRLMSSEADAKPGTPPSPSKSVPMPMWSTPATLIMWSMCATASSRVAFSSSGAEEAAIEGALRHTTSRSECTELVVGEIARMIAEHLGRGMTANDGDFGHCQGIVERGFSSVGKVYHHAHAVHLCHDFTTESRETAMSAPLVAGNRSLSRALGRAESQISLLPIVAKGGIDDAAFGDSGRCWLDLCRKHSRFRCPGGCFDSQLPCWHALLRVRMPCALRGNAPPWR